MDQMGRGKVIGGAIAVVAIVGVLGYLVFRGPSCSLQEAAPEAAKELTSLEASRAKAGFDGYLKLNGDKKFVALNLKSVDFKSNTDGTASMNLNFDCAELAIKFSESATTKSYSSSEITLTSDQIKDNKISCKINNISIRGSKGTPFQLNEKVTWDCYDSSAEAKKTGDQLVVNKILVDLYNKDDSK